MYRKFNHKPKLIRMIAINLPIFKTHNFLYIFVSKQVIDVLKINIKIFYKNGLKNIKTLVTHKFNKFGC